MIYIPEPEEEGKRIDSFLAERMEMSRSAIQQLIADGLVMSDGKPVTKSLAVKQGMNIEAVLAEPENCGIEAENIPLDIVYEDADLLVVNKAKGMVVHPAPGNYSGTLVNALMWHCGDSLSGINGVIRPGIVHRIDKNTSGLLIVAKNDRAHIGLASQISDHSFLRSYQAVAVGRMKSEKGRIEAPIGRNPSDRKKMAVVSDGRRAVTNWELITQYEGFAHINCVLETGRTHQIRVHMAHIGHPLMCDDVYGAANSRFERQNAAIVNGQCLHAKTIGFVHPVTGEDMFFDSELPEYFKTVLRKLESKNENI